MIDLANLYERLLCLAFGHIPHRNLRGPSDWDRPRCRRCQTRLDRN